MRRRIAGARILADNNAVNTQRSRLERTILMPNSFGSLASLTVGDRQYSIHRLRAMEDHVPAARSLPFSLKVLLENLLRTEDGKAVRPEEIEALARWDAAEEPSREI